MSHPLDEVKDTPWKVDIDRLEQEFKEAVVVSPPTTPNNRNGWRLSKDVPISLLVAFAIQTLAFTWFLSSQNGKLNTVIEDSAASKVTAYTKEDARHEREFMDQRFLLIQNKADETTRRLALVEAQFNELKSRSGK